MDDDFFSLGGDSILGAELVARIAERNGRKLPLTTLMWAPTLGAFMSLVEDGSWDEDSLIVPVQVKGTRPLLRRTRSETRRSTSPCSSARSGRSNPYTPCAPASEALRYKTVEDMSEGYFSGNPCAPAVGAVPVRQRVPGGAIVMEPAKRAEESGDDVRLVAVIDPRREFGRRGFRHYARRAGELARSGRLLWGV